jgi:hypothetical protein
VALLQRSQPFAAPTLDSCTPCRCCRRLRLFDLLLNLELIDQPPPLLGQFGQIVWISSVAFWVFCARLLTSSATTEKLDLDGAERA